MRMVPSMVMMNTLPTIAYFIELAHFFDPFINSSDKTFTANEFRTDNIVANTITHKG